MITQISYNVLIERFRAFAAGHYLIKQFTHGHPSVIDIEKGLEFPWMHVFPVEVEPRPGSRLYSFVVTFADLPRDKETPTEYEREIISDCIKLAEDLVAEIQNGLVLFGPTVELEGSPSIEVFIQEYSQTLTGVNLAITLSVPWDWSACDIPADWTVGGSGSGGSGGGNVGLVLKTNGENNAVQSLLNLQQGTNITLVDQGNGTVLISASGGGGGGGVSSVGLSMPSGFTVTNSPITGAGTLAVTANGTSSDYLDGTGAVQPFPAIPDELRDLTDVDITGPLQNDTLLFDAGNNEFINGQLGAVAYSNDYGDLNNLPTIPVNLDDLGDVNAAAPTNGQVLAFNSTSGDWEAITPASGGSVTSVGLSMPAPVNPAFSVSGSPVTTNGTLSVSANGNATQYVDGSGALQTFPTLPPTVGDMLKSVYDLQDVGVVESAHKELVSVINKTGATVTKGQIVYLKTTSSSGTHPEVVLATATTEVGSSKTIGAIWEDIANNAVGWVVTTGEVSNLDTSAYNIGDRLWLGTTAGSVTTTPPAEPNHTVFIGTVTRSQNVNGRVLYAIQNGYELNELHGVLITSEANRQGLFYNSTSGLWENRLIATADLPTGIDAANIGTGTVSNTEFGYLDGVTSAIQTQINAKANTASPAFTGTPTAPTATPGTNNTQLATTAFVQSTISGGASVPSYTMKGNNTGASAVATDHSFKYPGNQVYDNVLNPINAGALGVFGAGLYYYNWMRIGNMVHFMFQFYPNTGFNYTSGSRITWDLPSDMPSPVVPSGFSANSNWLMRNFISACTDLTATNSITFQGGLRVKIAATPTFEFSYASTGTLTGGRLFEFTGTYFTS